MSHSIEASFTHHRTHPLWKYDETWFDNVCTESRNHHSPVWEHFHYAHRSLYLFITPDSHTSTRDWKASEKQIQISSCSSCSRVAATSCEVQSSLGSDYQPIQQPTPSLRCSLNSSMCSGYSGEQNQTLAPWGLHSLWEIAKNDAVAHGTVMGAPLPVPGPEPCRDVSQANVHTVSG